MSHFAELDDDNKVIRVVVGDNDLPEEGKLWIEENLGGRWVQTSYSGSFRGLFAGKDFIFDEKLDLFFPPKPFESWVFNFEIMAWEAPEPLPESENYYFWDEDTVSWKTQ